MSARKPKRPPMSSFVLMHAFLSSLHKSVCIPCRRVNTSACADCTLHGLANLLKRVNTRLEITAHGCSTRSERDSGIIADILVRVCKRSFARSEIPELRGERMKGAFKGLIREGCLRYRNGSTCDVELTEKGVRYAIMNCTEFRSAIDGHNTKQESKQ